MLPKRPRPLQKWVVLLKGHANIKLPNRKRYKHDDTNNSANLKKRQGRCNVNMAEKTTPMWARLLEVILGIIVLVLAVYVLFNTGAAVNTLRWLLGIGVLILGLIMLIRGATSKVLSGTGRVVNVILGIIFLAVGASAIYYSNFGTTLVILLFAFGLLLNAIGRLQFAGYSVAAGMPPSVRWANIILGVIAFILAIVAFVDADFANTFLGLLVALVLFLFGIQLVIAGAGSRG
jgi:uncharacterized membrane protein HdeD (DUF308 family)